MAETIRPSQRSFARADADQAQFLSRWLKVWVTLLTVVTLVVVVYLIAITNSLANINGNLAVADDAVTGAGGDVVTLPDQVERVNSSLGGIDPALKNIPAQADTIIASLTSINSKLTTVDGSLKDTDGVLKVVLGTGSDIRGVLVDADDPPDRLGVQNIHRRVAFANGFGETGWLGANPGNLSAAKADAGNILAGLIDVNKHLVGICKSTAVSLQRGAQPC